MTQKIKITLAIFAFGLANAQQLPFVYKVNVTTKVLSSQSQGYYNYSYRILNNPQNIGSVESFEINASRDTASLDLDTTGLLFTAPGIRQNFIRRFPYLRQHIVPFSFYHLPPRWFASMGMITNAFTFLDTLFILPGQTIDGIELMSRGLPGIRSFIVKPWFDIDAYFGTRFGNTEPDPDVQDSIIQSVNYNGATVGPVSPPKHFSQPSWCDTISSYVTRSRSFGWINNQSTTNKYLDYFSTAKSQLQTNNTQSARVTLQQVLSDVNADSTSNLTSEAYALIRYNTEYLITKLFIPLTK